MIKGAFMKLYIVSDLHLEFAHFVPPSISHEANVIVLAGDIGKSSKGIYWARETWPETRIIYVAGNHEFYGKRRGDVLAALRIAAHETGVYFLDDEEVIIDDVRFLATLWTDFKLFGNHMQRKMMQAATKGLNDFRFIWEDDNIFRPSDALRLFDQSVAFLTQKLLHEKFVGPTIVVIHHLPSQKSVAERFKEDELSACFASKLDYLVAHSDLWIHGHTHDSFDYILDGTRVICNPRGYCMYDKEQENATFNAALVAEL